MMTDPLSTPPASVVTDGMLDRKQLASDVRKSERTIIRWERAGMPFIRLGMMRLYEPAKVRAWVLQHEHRPCAPKLGRPRTRGA